MTPSSMYLAEFIGTASLLLLGNGINMTLSLRKSLEKAEDGWCYMFWMGTCCIYVSIFDWMVSELILIQHYLYLLHLVEDWHLIFCQDT